MNELQKLAEQTLNELDEQKIKEKTEEIFKELEQKIEAIFKELEQREVVGIKQRVIELEGKLKSVEEKIKLLNEKICQEPTCWWAITREENGFPVQVYENEEVAKKVAGKNPIVKVVPAIEENDCWAIVITDCYTRGTSLIYDNVKRAEMYAEFNRGKVIKVKKVPT